MLALVLTENRLTFWLAFGLLIIVGVQDLYEHVKARTFLRGGAQVLLILFIWLTLLNWLAENLLALPQDFFAAAIHVVSQLRLLLLILFGSIIVLATVASVLPKFTWPYKNFVPEPDVGDWLSIFVQPVVLLLNTLANSVVNLSGVFVEAVVDAIRFVREVFFDPDIWRTILNVGWIAFWTFSIPYLVVLVTPHLFQVLRNPSVFASLGGGFDPTLAFANLWLGGIFLAGVCAILGLSRAWLPRQPERRSNAAKRISNTTVVVFVCVWAATLTYFYPIGLIAGFDRGLWWPGLYTLLAMPLALFGVLFRRSSLETPAQSV